MAISDHNNLQANSLFNGNISSMEVNIAKLNQPLAYKYRYDQLNRLKQVRAFDGFNIYNNSWENMNPLAAYAENYQYDPNGNILTLKRNGSADLTDMDDFTYHYIAGTNKLDYVSDIVPSGNYKTDIDNQPAGNYKYDEIGNLIKDVSGCIDSISWTVYGKVWKVYKCNKDSLIFAYDPMGGRVMKTYWNDSLHRKEQTIYVRDATGNEMAMYKLVNNDTLILSQQAIYGSSRLGVLERDEIVSIDSSLHPQMPTIPDPLTENVTHWARGHKRYELTNHLGNVLATVNDRKLPVYANNNFSYYKAEVMTANDYYAFGMVEPKRSFDTSDYRFAFGGHEKDNEVHGEGNWYTFGDYGYDPRIVQRPRTEPLTQKYPQLSPYVAFNGNPITYKDPDGRDGIISIQGNTITVSAKIHIYGSGATAATAQQMQNDIMGRWDSNNGKGWTYTDESGKKFDVKFDVSVELYKGKEKSDPLIIPESWNPTNRDNFIEVGASPKDIERSEVVKGDEGTWRGFGRNGATLAEDDPAAHEFGHLLGLGDRYSDPPNGGASVPNAGWEGNVMANGKTGKAEQKNIDAMVGDAVKGYNKFISNKDNANKTYTHEVNIDNPSK